MNDPKTGLVRAWWHVQNCFTYKGYIYIYIYICIYICIYMYWPIWEWQWHMLYMYHCLSLSETIPTWPEMINRKWSLVLIGRHMWDVTDPSCTLYEETCMMTSSHGNIFHVTGPLCGEFTGHRWIPLTKASNMELWCFFDLCLNKRLSKQLRCQWFETPSCSLWRRCNGSYCPA